MSPRSDRISARALPYGKRRTPLAGCAGSRLGCEAQKDGSSASPQLPPVELLRDMQQAGLQGNLITA